MGRQWLLAKRLVAGAKKAKTNTKLVRDIALAARGGADPAMNARLSAAIEKAKKESCSKDAIQRAINKGAGIGDDKLVLEHVVYEGRAPHNVPVIVEVYTDNVQRMAPEIRVLFRKGQLATSGANKFMFDQVGLVEAHRPTDANIDLEEAAIEAGASDVQPLTREQNDDIPPDATGAKFICERTDVATVSKWLSANGWTVITSEIGYLPKALSDLTEDPAGRSRRVPPSPRRTRRRASCVGGGEVRGGTTRQTRGGGQESDNRLRPVQFLYLRMWVSPSLFCKTVDSEIRIL